MRKELFLDSDGDLGDDTSSIENEMLPFLIVTDSRSIEGLYLLVNSQQLTHLWRVEIHLQKAF